MYLKKIIKASSVSWDLEGKDLTIKIDGKDFVTITNYKDDDELKRFRSELLKWIKDHPDKVLMD